MLKSNRFIFYALILTIILIDIVGCSSISSVSTDLRENSQRPVFHEISASSVHLGHNWIFRITPSLGGGTKTHIMAHLSGFDSPEILRQVIFQGLDMRVAKFFKGPSTQDELVSIVDTPLSSTLRLAEKSGYGLGATTDRWLPDPLLVILHSSCVDGLESLWNPETFRVDWVISKKVSQANRLKRNLPPKIIENYLWRVVWDHQETDESDWQHLEISLKRTTQICQGMADFSDEMRTLVDGVFQAPHIFQEIHAQPVLMIPSLQNLLWSQFSKRIYVVSKPFFDGRHDLILDQINSKDSPSSGFQLWSPDLIQKNPKWSNLYRQWELEQKFHILPSQEVEASLSEGRLSDVLDQLEKAYRNEPLNVWAHFWYVLLSQRIYNDGYQQILATFMASWGQDHPLSQILSELVVARDQGESGPNHGGKPSPSQGEALRRFPQVSVPEESAMIRACRLWARGWIRQDPDLIEQAERLWKGVAFAERLVPFKSHAE